MRLIILALYVLPYLLHSQEPTREQIKQVAEAKKVVKRMKGAPFPVFESTDINGNTYTKEQLKGKVFLVNFWFTRCKPCIMEIPEMNEMVEEFQGEEVLFLAPTFDDELQIQKFLSKRDFAYQIIPNVKDFCIQMHVQSYPTHFVVNREGIIKKVIIGYSIMTVKALKKSLKKLVKE